MDLTALLIHLLNFVAPAMALALVLPAVAQILGRKTSARLAWWSQVAIVFIACSVALVLGLVYFGRDGKMATYVAMVLVGASTQWFLRRG